MAPHIYPLHGHWFKSRKWIGGIRSVYKQFVGLEPLLNRIADKTILDVGCAEGLISFELLRRGGKLVHGIDIDRTCVAYAAKTFNGFEGRFWCWDADKIDTLPKLLPSYDVTLLLAVLHKLQDPGRMVKYAAEHTNEIIAVRSPAPILRDSSLAIHLQNFRLIYSKVASYGLTELFEKA